MTRLARVVALVASILGLASCAEDEDGGPTASGVSAPGIANLRVQPLDPERTNRDVRYDATADFTDPNGDVVGGQCEILLNGQSIGRVTLDPVPRSVANPTSGRVLCQFVVNAGVPQQVAGTLRVFDLAGNQSNDLSFILSITQLPRGRAPSAPVEGRLESATAGR